MTINNQIAIFERPQQLHLPCSTFRKSNEMARAATGLDSVAALRVIACIAACVRPDDEPNQVYTVPMSKLNHKYTVNGYRSGKVYNEIINIIEDIKCKGWVELVSSNKKRGISTVLLNSIYYDFDNYIIRATINPQIIEHFLTIKQYVECELDNYLMLSSVYSQLLYETLCSIKSLKDFKLALPYLYDRLKVTEKSRNYRDFSHWVLNFAQKEIHKHTDLRFAWFPCRENNSKATTHIRFVFTQDKIAAIKKELEQAKKKKKSAKNNDAVLRIMACRKRRGLYGNESACETPSARCSKERQKLCREFFCKR